MLTARQMIIALANKHTGDWHRIFADIQTKNMNDLKRSMQILVALLS